MISKILNFLNSNKIIPFFIITPIVYAIGTATEEILIGAQKARKMNKKILIIFPTWGKLFFDYDVCNNFLSSHLILNNYKQFEATRLKKFITLLVNIELIISRSIIFVFKYFLNKQTKEKLKFPRVGINFSYSEDNINHKNLKKVKFNEIPALITSNEKINIIRDEKHLYKIKDQIKFDFDEPYVCLQVRDSAFYNDSNRKDYRNSNITNYYEMIKLLLSKNFKVVRMGSKVHHKLKIKDKNLIDYPFSNFYNKYLDLYFIQNCNFYIGTSSGLIDIAWMFNRPVLLTNMVNIFSGLPRNEIDRGIFKKIYHNDKKLSLSEYMDLPFSFHNLDSNIDDLKYEENSSEELHQAAVSFVDNLEKNDKKLDQNQILFNSLVIQRLEKMFYERSEINCLSNYHACLNMMRITKSCKGSLSSFFLKKHLN